MELATSPAQLEALAARLKAASDDIAEDSAVLRDASDRLSSGWSGEAQRAFASAEQNASQQAKQRGDDLVTASSMLEALAAKYVAMDKRGARALGRA